MLGAALQNPISKLKKSAVSKKPLVPIHELQRLTTKWCSTIEAMNAADAYCGCGKRCLRSIDAEETSYHQSSEVIKSCRNEVAHYKFDEKYSFLRKKVDESLLAPTKMGYLQHKFTVGVKGSATRYPVCRRAFCLAYGVSHYMLDRISSDIKVAAGQEIWTRELGDSSASKLSMADFRKLCDTHGLQHVSDEQIQAGILPNSPQSNRCIAWMFQYFSRCGDKVPNRDNEVNLEWTQKKAVHVEYVDDTIRDYPDCPVLVYSRFVVLWNTAFPNVKIREYKQVTGKCMQCALITELRGSCQDALRRQLLVDLHSLHRSMYMAERVHYYNRQRDAIEHSDTTMSAISDGMSQNHTKNPWLGNQKEFSAPITQHLQGVLEHTDSVTPFVVFRTFETVSDDSNMAIHCLLLKLEAWKERKGHYPTTVYWQVDGGSENINQFFMGMCELLVIAGIVEKFVLTRLPVGHTHEDIDARFGKLWTYFRSTAITTPQEYKTAIEKVFQPGTCKVVDIHAVPDYKGWLKDCLDPKLKHYGKEEYTQLQFIFEKTTPSRFFPHGCIDTYAAYSAKQVIEICVSQHPHQTEVGMLLGLQAVNTEVLTYPQPTADKPAGMFLLKSLPTGRILPANFPAGSRASLEKTLSQVRAQLNGTTGTIRLWEEFAASVPLNDNVYDWVAAHPLHVPFAEEFDFAILGKRKHCDRGAVERKRATILRTAPKMRSGESVVWSGREGPFEEPRVALDPGPAELLSRRRDRFKSYPDQLNYSVTNATLTRRLRQRGGLLLSGNKPELQQRLRASDDFEIYSRFRDINEAEESFLKDAFDRIARLDDQIIAENHVSEMRPSKFSELGGEFWLSSYTINYMMGLFAERDSRLQAPYNDPSSKQAQIADGNRRLGSLFLSSFVADRLRNQDPVDEARFRHFRDVKVNELDKIFFPINITNTHWVIAVAYVQAKKLVYYDSYGAPDSHGFLPRILRFIEDAHARSEPPLEWNSTAWQCECNPDGEVRQLDGFQCGVHVITVADLISMNLPLHYGHSDMVNRRKMIALEILAHVDLKSLSL